MKAQPCNHQFAYVVGEGDLTDPAGDSYRWECGACGECGEETNDMDVAAASLQASQAVKH